MGAGGCGRLAPRAMGEASGKASGTLKARHLGPFHVRVPLPVLTTGRKTARRRGVGSYAERRALPFLALEHATERPETGPGVSRGHLNGGNSRLSPRSVRDRAGYDASPGLRRRIRARGLLAHIASPLWMVVGIGSQQVGRRGPARTLFRVAAPGQRWLSVSYTARTPHPPAWLTLPGQLDYTCFGYGAIDLDGVSPIVPSDVLQSQSLILSS